VRRWDPCWPERCGAISCTFLLFASYVLSLTLVAADNHWLNLSNHLARGHEFDDIDLVRHFRLASFRSIVVVCSFTFLMLRSFAMFRRSLDSLIDVKDARTSSVSRGFLGHEEAFHGERGYRLSPSYHVLLSLLFHLFVTLNVCFRSRPPPDLRSTPSGESCTGVPDGHWRPLVSPPTSPFASLLNAHASPSLVGRHITASTPIHKSRYDPSCPSPNSPQPTGRRHRPGSFAM